MPIDYYNPTILHNIEGALLLNLKCKKPASLGCIGNNVLENKTIKSIMGLGIADKAEDHGLVKNNILYCYPADNNNKTLRWYISRSNSGNHPSSFFVYGIPSLFTSLDESSKYLKSLISTIHTAPNALVNWISKLEKIIPLRHTFYLVLRFTLAAIFIIPFIFFMFILYIIQTFLINTFKFMLCITLII